jgi:hypothetical protein
MLISAGELCCVRSRIRVWRPISITFEGDRRHTDIWALRELLFDLVVFRLALGQSESPSVFVHHNGNMILVFERRGAPIKCHVIKTPLW